MCNILRECRIFALEIKVYDMEEKKKSQSYKQRTTLSNDTKLMISVGVILSSWRDSQQWNENGDGKPLTIGAVAKVLNERYEKVYRIENGGGTPATLIKYLCFIKQRDPSFDFFKKLRDSMGESFPKY